MSVKRLGWMSAAALLLAGLFGSVLTGADEPGKGKKDKDEDGSGKVIILKLDVSNLPPGVLEKLLQAAGKSDSKPAVTPTKGEEKEKGKKGKGKEEAPAKVTGISLTEAIARAEKATGGTATRAERQDEDKVVSYRIDLRGKDGARVRVTLDASGKVQPAQKKDEDRDEQKGKKDEGKGKAQKKEKDEDEGKGKKGSDEGKGKVQKKDKDDDDEDEKGEGKAKKKDEDEGKGKKGEGKGKKKEKDDDEDDDD
jgi:hypothetical protein